MKNFSDDRRFLDLLQKWWAGDFRRTDQRELDALTGTDDFRREAFEGFEENAQAVSKHEVSAMRARFEQKYRRSKGRAVPLAWALTAAAIGLMVLATVWLFDGFSGPSGVELATSKPMQSFENQPVGSDSGAVQPVVSIPHSEGKPVAGLATSPGKSVETTAPQNLPGTSPKEFGDGQIATAIAADSRNEVAEYTPVAPINISTADDAARPESAIAQSAETEAEMVKPASPKPGKTSRLPADRNIFQNDSNFPTAPQNADSRALEKTAETKKKQEKIRTPEPEMGWPAWEKWLAENRRLPESAHISGIRGEVKLKFYVDKNGQPTQIFVVESPGSGLETEAVRLLQTGPKWTKERGEVRLSIEF